MQWNLYAAGSCRHLEAAAMRGGSWRQVDFPAMFATVLSAEGWLLVDTGYAPRVLEACQHGWWRLYPWLLPVTVSPEVTAAAQLQDLPVAAIFLTHFHADHEGGLRDFPGVPIYTSRPGWHAVRNSSGFAALRAVHHPGLLPDDFEKRLQLLEPGRQHSPPSWVPTGWETGCALPGMIGFWVVPLPGHAAGQCGMMFLDENQQVVFLVADAIWRVGWLREGQGPRSIIRLATHDWSTFQQTLRRLRLLAAERPDIRIIPFHCAETKDRYVRSELSHPFSASHPAVS